MFVNVMLLWSLWAEGLACMHQVLVSYNLVYAPVMVSCAGPVLHWLFRTALCFVCIPTFKTMMQVLELQYTSRQPQQPPWAVWEVHTCHSRNGVCTSRQGCCYSKLMNQDTNSLLHAHLSPLGQLASLSYIQAWWQQRMKELIWLSMIWNSTWLTSLRPQIKQLLLASWSYLLNGCEHITDAVHFDSSVTLHSLDIHWD